MTDEELLKLGDDIEARLWGDAARTKPPGAGPPAMRLALEVIARLTSSASVRSGRAPT